MLSLIPSLGISKHFQLKHVTRCHLEKPIKHSVNLQFFVQAIAFIADVASINRNRAHTVQCIIDCCLESIASVAMFYDKGDPCQKNAERLINGILTIHIVSTDPNIRLMLYPTITYARIWFAHRGTILKKWKKKKYDSMNTR